VSRANSGPARKGREGVRLVALFRGINVGRAKRVAMADLRELAARLGFEDVRTLLNSGNLVFTARGRDALRAAFRIETALEASLGITSRVTVLTATELAAIVEDNPPENASRNPSRLLVAIPRDAESLSRLKPLAKRDWRPGSLSLGGRAAYMWCPERISASALANAVGEALGDGVTTRNWATVGKLHDLVR
jgi:uncharacterized protein (DUF1697 family)